MKDFVKWLGVNEKIAKLVVWVFVIMLFLILTNTMLDSFGLKHYKITYENLKQIQINQIFNNLLSCLVNILNFYCIVLLVFKIKDVATIFKFALPFMIISWIVTSLFGNAVLQVFIFLYITIFVYHYSGKKKKYCLYGLAAIFINIIVQSIVYLYKVKGIDYTTTNELTRFLLFSDYFIIMIVIILVKEIYLRKRGDKICGADQEVYFGSANSKKKEN